MRQNGGKDMTRKKQSPEKMKMTNKKQDKIINGI